MTQEDNEFFVMLLVVLALVCVAESISFVYTGGYFIFQRLLTGQWVFP